MKSSGCFLRRLKTDSHYPQLAHNYPQLQVQRYQHPFLVSMGTGRAHGTQLYMLVKHSYTQNNKIKIKS